MPGTISGYARHRRLGEAACEDCWTARAVHPAGRRRAAMAELARRHQREFEQLVDELSAG